MTKKTKARSTTKPTARARSPKKPAHKRAARPKTRRPAARPKTRRPAKKRARPTGKPLAPKPSDMKRPVPGEPVRIQPPPELVKGRRDPAGEETAAPPHIDESARDAEMERERQRLREVPERKRPNRVAVDANRWVHRQPNERRGSAWQARGHSTMRGR